MPGKNLQDSAYHLDAIDREIIYMLVDNSKTSLAHIATKVGISTTAVHQRIKKLENAEVIESTISILNPRKIGYKVVAFVSVSLVQPSYYNEVIELLQDVNEVVEAHYTTGNHSLFIKVICRDNEHLLDVLTKIQHIKAIEKTETFISLDQKILRQLKV
ncbi:transcriptional regulator [Chryseobacterium sp. Leaf180]|uniref:Lrp/AsnC family transcriptional regulator n=1 Tax=Chryseobacterium sp. Leaf180 TaxID=1736289 RepID=UPI0006F540A3|nr:Lrp/AsnC ligand binding domain-containing protein [Chryseobacterium sp. Leaf180]KQR91938.1 transcriptional regulator [Chryseobacterium sp. Leaf180]